MSKFHISRPALLALLNHPRMGETPNREGICRPAEYRMQPRVLHVPGQKPVTTFTGATWRDTALSLLVKGKVEEAVRFAERRVYGVVHPPMRVVVSPDKPAPLPEHANLENQPDRFPHKSARARDHSLAKRAKRINSLVEQGSSRRQAEEMA